MICRAAEKTTASNPSSVKACDDDISSGDGTPEYGIRAGVSIFVMMDMFFSEIRVLRCIVIVYTSPKTVRTLVYRSRMSQNVRRVRDVSPRL